MSDEPRATYRVQLHAGFGLADLAEVVPYLAALGVSHVYLSPILQARPGSTHGYDVIDPGRIDADRGGADGYERLCAALARHGLSIVLDIIPNHMAIAGRGNPWWWDVLENGPASHYAPYFDVDWDSPDGRLPNRVLLPVLGDQVGKVLDAGEIRLVREGATFTFRYHEHLFPVAPRSLDQLLRGAALRCHSTDLGFLADAFGGLPESTAKDPARLTRRHRDKQVLLKLLERLLREDPRTAVATDEEIARIAEDVDRLDAMLDRQNYRLAHWRTASRELGYRRFFDINSLVALRTEDERVFDDTHALPLRLLRDGMVTGLRVDHPDGLRDPAAYFARLREAAPRLWIVAEKLLAEGERLPEDWPIAGTTGYDFLARVSGLFVDPQGREPLVALYAELTGESVDWSALAREKKHLVLREGLGSDVDRLTDAFLEICERHRHHRDHTRDEVRAVLRELIACFPVYRTYLRAEAGEISDADARRIEAAAAAAKQHRPELPLDLIDFALAVLLLRVRGEREADFVMRFQQVTGPAMAKGVEDTAFYSYFPFVALNEVGGDPSTFGTSVRAFHGACTEAQMRRPAAMLATSTHDTKRSEDVRARLAVLSEVPERWAEAVRGWIAHNQRHRGNELVDRNTEYLFYQTLVGTWPIEEARMLAYLEKAIREAKRFTSWTAPQPAYEEAVRIFVSRAMRDSDFCAEAARFVGTLLPAAWTNALAQTLLKLTAPGVPDLYQGTELWELSLVDPDNRRAVDYSRRAALLEEAQRLGPEEAWARADEGLPKIWTMRRTLAFRAARPELFGPTSSYAPVLARGPQARHVVAFARGAAAVTVVPRLTLRRNRSWEQTTIALAPGRWRNVLAPGDSFRGGEVPVAEVLGRFPVALLAREGEP